MDRGSRSFTIASLLPEDGVTRTFRHDLLQRWQMSLVQCRVINLCNLFVFDISERLWQHLDAVSALGAEIGIHVERLNSAHYRSPCAVAPGRWFLHESC